MSRKAICYTLMILATDLFVIAPSIFGAIPQEKSFSGIWVLDKERTKDLPGTLESLTLKVDQTVEQLSIDAVLVGEIRPARGQRSAPGGLSTGFPGGGRRGGMGGGGMGGGGAMGGGMGGGGAMGGGMGGGGAMGGGMGGDGPSPAIPREILMQMALAAPIRQAIFPLNGNESVVDIPGSAATGDRAPAPGMRVTLKAGWRKDGRQLELVLTRKYATEGGERTLVNRDRWEIEKDGTLLIRRQVETRLGGQEVKLHFRRSAS